MPIELDGGTLTIEWDGEPDRLRRWYEFWRGRWMADPNALERYPTIVLSVPADVEVDIESIIGHWTIGDREGHISFGAERVSGSIGAPRSADISISGDAELELGAVREMLSASVAGSGSLRAGDAGDADISLAGSGDVTLDSVAGDLTANVSGSGWIVAGDASRAEITVSGSGSVRFGAASSGLLAVVQGSGNVSADSVTGVFEALVSGSGGLILGAVEGQLDAATTGAGRVQVLR